MTKTVGGGAQAAMSSIPSWNMRARICSSSSSGISFTRGVLGDAEDRQEEPGAGAFAGDGGRRVKTLSKRTRSPS